MAALLSPLRAMYDRRSSDSCSDSKSGGGASHILLRNFRISFSRFRGIGFVLFFSRCAQLAGAAMVGGSRLAR